MPHPLFADAHITHHANPGAAAGEYPAGLREHFSLSATAEAVREISQWPGYQATELVRLDGLADEFGVGAIYYKDESTRFGLGSFKALGGAFAVLGLLQQLILAQTGKKISGRDLENGGRDIKNRAHNVTVVTATDGNHGRSVAWGAKRFGCRCRIYIHAEVSEARADAMAQLGAEVIRIDGNYDESVRRAADDAARHGWYVVSDTSYSGYTELPARVMAGYGVMMAEIFAQLPQNESLSHVFVQGGVGGLAAAVAAWLWETFDAKRPRFTVVEPALADCLLQSAVNQRATRVEIFDETVMAGLSCGEVSQLAWQVLRVAADDFIAIGDELVAPVMALLAGSKPPVVGGESGVAGLAGCLAMCVDRQRKAAVGLNQDSRVLVFGTEGATDRGIYDAMVRRGGGMLAAGAGQT